MQLTRNFHLVEFGCRDGTPVPVDLVANVRRLAEQLQVLRTFVGKPIRVTSGYRTAVHNTRVGSTETSRHRTGEAADIVVAGVPPDELAREIEWLVTSGRMVPGGLGVYPGFVHYDVRDQRARWRRG